MSQSQGMRDDLFLGGVIVIAMYESVEEGLEKCIVLMLGSGEMKGNKERVVHPDMTGKLAWRLILEACRQELNNLACSLKFPKDMEWPWLCIRLSIN